MIAHLVYVICDGCGNPAGGADDLRDDAAEARKRAIQLGFVRVPSADVPPWPEDFLARLNVEVKAVRRRHTKLRQVGRRLARKADGC